jgi:hypothetical protein
MTLRSWEDLMLVDVERCIFALKKNPDDLAAWVSGDRVHDGTGLRLSEEERRAIAETDVEALWSMGVHPLLLLQFARAAGIPTPDYYARIRNSNAERTIQS